MRMDLISQIEIRYFRSIHYLKLTNIKSMNVVSGANDAGKSNLLKALNLFFNSQTDFLTEVNFYNDFNLMRLQEVRQESIKGKQFIQIKITFRRGDRSPNTLPEFFTVTRTWHRESKVPTQSDDLEKRLKGKDISMARARASLSKFLDSIKYEYIPAVKDNNLFGHIMTNLQEALFNLGSIRGDQIGNKLKGINSDIGDLVHKLNLEFESVTGISSSLSLPTTLSSLYTSFLVNTLYGENEVPLEQRGDGIKIRYIPSIMYYIANVSNKQFIWGFEEPENSLEYKLCTNMASDFLENYSKGIQIFTTTHSPAFLSLKSENSSLYRIFKQGFQTKSLPINEKDKVNVSLLNDELGLTRLLQEQHEFYLSKMEELKLERMELDKLNAALGESRKPSIITEGKTDRMILEIAWERLYPGVDRPFNIASCDLEDDNGGGGAAGCGILRKQLESVKHDSQFIIIGLLDYDQAGMDAFKLDRNYTLVEGYSNIKRNKNGKGYAILLPIPEGKEQFQESRNYPIEFYFDEEYLRKELDGFKLGIVQPVIPIPLQGVIIGQHQTTELYHAQIKSNTKTKFAETIVPSFEDAAFKNFDILFGLILKIINGEI